MLCQLNKKRGSVKYYLNYIPFDIIKIIKEKIHFTKTLEYKIHKKNNKKLLKQIKKIEYIITYNNIISSFSIPFFILNNKFETIRLQILMNNNNKWECDFKYVIESKQLRKIKLNHSEDIYKIFNEQFRPNEKILKRIQ